MAWIYTRAGWPVEITAEFENWRRIRDCDGAEGWVYHSLLSGKRTAAVQLKTKTDLAPIYQIPDVHSAMTARLQVGVLGSVKLCTGTWCQFPATALPAGSSRALCGASILAKKLNDRDFRAIALPHP